MKITFHKVLLSLFIIAQVYFIFAIVKEKIIEPLWMVLFLVLILIMILSYKKSSRLHISKPLPVNYGVFLLFIIGGFSTYFLHHSLHFNTVLSAGLVGFLGSFIPKFKQIKSSNSWPVMIYCGAFVGMTNLNLGYYHLFAATLLTATFYTFTQHYFHGIGGKLGTLAFMGVLYSYLLFNIFS